jgi:hypothetical protein
MACTWSMACTYHAGPRRDRNAKGIASQDAVRGVPPGVRVIPRDLPHHLRLRGGDLAPRMNQPPPSQMSEAQRQIVLPPPTPPVIYLADLASVRRVPILLRDEPQERFPAAIRSMHQAQEARGRREGQEEGPGGGGGEVGRDLRSHDVAKGAVCWCRACTAWRVTRWKEPPRPSRKTHDGA